MRHTMCRPHRPRTSSCGWSSRRQRASCPLNGSAGGGRIPLALGHEALERSAGKFLVRGVGLAGREGGAGHNAEGEHQRQFFHGLLPRWIRSIVVCNPPTNQPAHQRRRGDAEFRRPFQNARVNDERYHHEGSGPGRRCRRRPRRQARRRQADRYLDPPCPEEPQKIR